MYKLYIPLLLILGLLTVIFAKDPIEIIKNYGLNIGKVPYEGVEISILFDDPDFPKTSVARVVANGKYMIRRDYLSPPFLLGKVNIDNGKYQYEFDPKKNIIRISPSGTIFFNRDEINKRLNLIKKNFSINLEAQEVYLGRKVNVLAISSKYTRKPVLRLWIDEEKYIPLRTDKYNSEGKIVGRVVFVEIKFNTKIPDDLFNVDFLKDKNVITEEMRLKEESIEKADVPSELPLGYSLIKYYIVFEKEDKITHYFKYTDGLNDMSFFKSSQPFRILGRPIEIGKFHVFYDSNILWRSLSWSEDNNFYLLIGDFPSNFLEAFVGTLIKVHSVK